MIRKRISKGLVVNIPDALRYQFEGLSLPVGFEVTPTNLLEYSRQMHEKAFDLPHKSREQHMKHGYKVFDAAVALEKHLSRK